MKAENKIQFSVFILLKFRVNITIEWYSDEAINYI